MKKETLQQKARRLDISISKKVKVNISDYSAKQLINSIEIFLRENKIEDADIVIDSGYNNAELYIEGHINCSDEELTRKIDSHEKMMKFKENGERSEYLRLKRKFENE